MTIVLAKPTIDLVPALQAFDAGSRGVSSTARVAERRIRSMQRLTQGTVADIRDANDRLARSKIAKQPIKQQLMAKSLALKKLLSAVSMYLDADWRAHVLGRLDAFLAPDDWEVGIDLPSEESFATFLRAIIYLHPTKRPGIGLSSKGNFLASWRRDVDRIVIEFLPKDQLRWVLSQTINGSPESGAGVNPIHRLPEVTAGWEPDRFFHDGEILLA